MKWSVCCICGVESASQKPILFLQRRQVCCYALWEGLLQLEKKKRWSIHSGLLSHLQSGQKKSEWWKWGELLLPGDRFNWLLMIWSIIHSKEHVDTSRNRICTYSFLFKQRCECTETCSVWKIKFTNEECLKYLSSLSLLTIQLLPKMQNYPAHHSKKL